MTGVPANRMHLPPSLWSDDKVARLKEMHAAGDAYSTMGEELGLSRGAISGKIDRLGMGGQRRKGVNPKVDAKKARASKDRNTTQRIARIVKVRGPSNGGPVIVDAVVHDEGPQPAGFLGITFLDLEHGQCKFPRGEGRHILFCGQPQMSGESYCRKCCAIAFTYTPPPKREYFPLGRSKPAVF